VNVSGGYAWRALDEDDDTKKHLDVARLAHPLNIKAP